MILKNSDDKSPMISELERLERLASGHTKKQISDEIRFMRAGIKGENEAAYLIDFDYKDSKNTIILHDLRLEHNGRVAQIDHLLIHRSMMFLVLETKHFASGLKYTKDGEFLRWNDWKKTFEGMASPLSQNERHITVLKDIVSGIKMPEGLIFNYKAFFRSLILVSSNARIDRHKDFKEGEKVIKADMLDKKYGELLKDVGSGAPLLEAVRVANALLALHKPASFDYAARFGISNQSNTSGAPIATKSPEVKIEPPPTPMAAAQAPAKSDAKCKKCSSHQLTMTFGKFGYYFKCQECGTNTAINASCHSCKGQVKIRKDKEDFFVDCPQCKSSHHFFSNKVGSHC